ncbi:MAG TPA: hypothetical protein VK172_14685 [Lentimicrobium sp.]|nr:hypothetical protein [Bacteroidales bacterium]HLO92408.1 hypothetical protein [Lentimicrobium sp.]
MARTITQIQNQIIDLVQADSTLSVKINSTSKVSVWRLFTFIIASAIWTLEMLFDTHKTEVEGIINNLTPHWPSWYCNKALAFQYGHSLIQDTDRYLVDDETAKIIQYASAVESVDGYLKLKVAKALDNTLDKLSGEWPNTGVSGPMTGSSGGSGEKLAFYIYMQSVKDAGVKIRFISQDPDHLRLVIDAYFDPMVLDNEGKRLDGTDNTPLQKAINSYIESLPFNGEFTNAGLTDAIQAVNGIKIPQILSTEACWGAYEWEIISAKYNPEAGWLKIYDNDLTINWIPYGFNL